MEPAAPATAHSQRCATLATPPGCRVNCSCSQPAQPPPQAVRNRDGCGSWLYCAIQLESAGMFNSTPCQRPPAAVSSYCPALPRPHLRPRVTLKNSVSRSFIWGGGKKQGRRGGAGREQDKAGARRGLCCAAWTPQPPAAHPYTSRQPPAQGLVRPTMPFRSTMISWRPFCMDTRAA